MHTYWHRHPRNFANECDIIRCDDPAHVPTLEAEGYTRLTRDELRRHIRWINEENAAWGSGRGFSSLHFHGVVDPSSDLYPHYSSHELMRSLAEREREEAELAVYAEAIAAEEKPYL